MVSLLDINHMCVVCIFVCMRVRTCMCVSCAAAGKTKWHEESSAHGC